MGKSELQRYLVFGSPRVFWVFYKGAPFVPLLHTTRYGPDGLFRLSAGAPAKTLETSQRVQNLLGLVSCGDQAMINA